MYGSLIKRTEQVAPKQQRNSIMGKAKTLKIADVVVARRGRTPQPLDSDLIADLKKLANGKVEALDLGPYFTELTASNKPAVGQKIRKHWTEGANQPNKALRLDFLVEAGVIQARTRPVEEDAETAAA